MTPDFQILADDRDVTAAIRARMLSMSVSDAAGVDADVFELSLDDRDGAVVMPRTGAELDVRMGFRQTGLHRMGRFVVDEVAVIGPPLRMTIRARAADLRQGLKRPRTRSWDGVTVGDVVAAIATEHGYQPRCAASLAGQGLGHIDQADESDLHFLTRLARDRGAVAKPAGGLLLFVPKGQAKSASGRDLPTAALAGDQIGTFEATIAERGKYLSVKARWHDAGEAQEQSVTVGDGEPVFTIGRRYPDRASAQTAAKARLDAFTRGVATLRLSCVGDTRLAAETRLTVTGLRDGVNGDWTVARVVHRIDGGGYACDIEAEATEYGRSG